MSNPRVTLTSVSINTVTLMPVVHPIGFSKVYNDITLTDAYPDILEPLIPPDIILLLKVSADVGNTARVGTDGGIYVPTPDVSMLVDLVNQQTALTVYNAAGVQIHP